MLRTQPDGPGPRGASQWGQFSDWRWLGTLVQAGCGCRANSGWWMLAGDRVFMGICRQGQCRGWNRRAWACAELWENSGGADPDWGSGIAQGSKFLGAAAAWGVRWGFQSWLWGPSHNPGNARVPGGPGRPRGEDGMGQPVKPTGWEYLGACEIGSPLLVRESSWGLRSLSQWGWLVLSLCELPCKSWT